MWPAARLGASGSRIARISRAGLPEASAIAGTHASAPVHRYPRRRLLLAVRRAAHSRAASSTVERRATRLLAERAAPRCRLRPRARARVHGWHGGTRTVEDGGTRRAAPARRRDALTVMSAVLALWTRRTSAAERRARGGQARRGTRSVR